MAYNQMNLADIATEDEDYKAFVDKFRPKKTTDDCYTPDNIYKVVADWVAKEYHLDPACFVRPFWPGGDYQNEHYPEGCVVVDNPPFSIRAQIMDFYNAYGIKYFLFAPTLTLLRGTRRGVCNRGVCNIAVGAGITYDNGAVVNTSFCTNLEPDTILRSAPDLYKALKEENRKNEKAQTKQLPKYSYPDNVVTAAIAYHYSQYGIPYRLRHDECLIIGELDEQKKQKKTIFGAGLLLNSKAAAEKAAAEKAAAEKAAAEKAAAEKAAAEKAAATRWQLSEREWEIVRGLDEGMAWDGRR